MIAHDGWETNYRAAIETIFHRLDPRRIAWVSLGSLRMTPRLKGLIRDRHQPGSVLATELVPGPDGKERVWRGMRVKMYRQLLAWLREVDPQMPVYRPGLATSQSSITVFTPLRTKIAKDP